MNTQPDRGFALSDPAVKAQEAQRSKNITLAAIISVVVALGVISQIVNPAKGPTAEQRAAQEAAALARERQVIERACRDMAFSIEDRIRARLKAPSTARFNRSPRTIYDNGTCTVYSWVDAQNSFGAMLRTFFTVEMTRITNDRWNVVDIRFSSQ